MSSVTVWKKRKQDILNFLTDVLKISSPMERRQHDSGKLLQDIMTAFYTTIPFQSITLIAQSPEARHTPSPDDIINDVISGRGGLCYTLNVFMKYLLQLLDYNVHHISSTVMGPPNNHILCLVCDLDTPGDRYLVDMGVGYPTFEPVSLKFEKESQIYKQSFLEYKFVWEEGLCIRCHRRGEKRPLLPGEVIIDGWRKVCFIDPSPKDLSFFDEPMHKVYGEPDLMYSPFHHSLRLVSFRCPHMKAVCIKDKHLLEEDDTHTMEDHTLTRKEIIEKVGELLPVLHDYTEAAVNNLNLYD